MCVYIYIYVYVEHLPEAALTILDEIAVKYNVSRYALVLRFFLQTGASTIPRSSQKDRLMENMKVFDWEIEDGDMRRLGWPLINEGPGEEEL